MFVFCGVYYGMINGMMGMMGNFNIKVCCMGLMFDVYFMFFLYSLCCLFGLGGDEGVKVSICYIECLLNDDEVGIMKFVVIIVEFV